MAAAYELVAVLKPQRPEAFAAPQDDGTTAPRSARRGARPDAVDVDDEDRRRRGDARARALLGRLGQRGHPALELSGAVRKSNFSAPCLNVLD